MNNIGNMSDLSSVLNKISEDIECMRIEIRSLKAEVQKLREEINRKGLSNG